ncbi:MAG: peptidase T [Oscillospiraceae bacterium]|nr:peptidase T [Oscillospiraceae bacterium]
MQQQQSLVERFLRYVRIDTQSDEESGRHPSTDKQRDLADLLVTELKDLGLDVDYDEKNCYVYAYLPPKDSDTDLGFIAHMDTSPAVSGKDVKPHIIHSYDGNDDILDRNDFPELNEHIGEDLIRTDGTTLLGADDKAGIAEIMEMLCYFRSNPEISHHGIAVAFTPDEEIGEGTLNFDLTRFHARQAYTVDGGKFGILEYECFNAAVATVEIKGKSVHTGSAKGIMINASLVANEFINLMPEDETPETTEGYEGFYYLDSIRSECERARMQFLIRDHDLEKFAARKEFMKDAAFTINERYGSEICKITIEEQYPNMAMFLKDHMDLIERAQKAVKKAGGNPSSEPVRGGTDGAILSSRGLPCPNLSTGGYNYHSRYEFASVPEMQRSLQVLICLAMPDN